MESTSSPDDSQVELGTDLFAPLTPVTEGRLIAAGLDTIAANLAAMNGIQLRNPQPARIDASSSDGSLPHSGVFFATKPTLAPSVKRVLDLHPATRPIVPVKKWKQWATPGDWDKHKPEIMQLYWVERKKAREVQDIMRQQHGFEASLKMYKDRLRSWGARKNYREEEIIAIARIKTERDAEGKPSQILREGTPVDLPRVMRHIKRKGAVSLPQYAKLVEVQEQGLRNRAIDIRAVTPPPHLEPPGQHHETERVMFSLRSWINGNFEAGVWDFGGRTLDIASACVSPSGRDSLYGFRVFYLRGRRLISSPGGVIEGNRALNLAFEELKYSLRRGDPLMLPVFIRETLRPANTRLNEMLWAYVNELALIIYGKDHPLTNTLKSLRRITLNRDNNTLKPITQLCMDLIERQAGFENSYSLMMRHDMVKIGRFLEESLADGLKHEEQDVRGVLSRAESVDLFRFPDLARDIPMWHLHLADNLFCQRRVVEAKALVELALLSHHLRPLDRVHALTLLAYFELDAGDPSASLAACREAIGIYEQSRDWAQVFEPASYCLDVIAQICQHLGQVELETKCLEWCRRDLEGLEVRYGINITDTRPILAG